MLERWIGISCVLPVLIVGCGSSESPEPDDLFKQSIRQWREAAAIVEGIRDEATLREAAGKLDALAQRMVDLNRKASAWTLDPRRRRLLEADNRKQSEAALKRFEEAAAKARALPGGEEVLSRFRRGANRSF